MVACIESIVFMLVYNLKIMEAISKQCLQQILLSGGLSRLDGLCQKIADLSDRPMHCVTNPEATVVGVAAMTGKLTPPPCRIQQTYRGKPNTALYNRYSDFQTHINQRLPQMP